VPFLSIITPIYKPVPDQLIAAYESVAKQEMPTGWQWEWLIQEDGRTGIAREILPADDRIVFGDGRPNGVAITRNLALSRARGDLVKNLDQDDILTPGVLTRDIEVFADQTVGWTTSRVLDLMPDGSTVGFDNDPPAGILSGNAVVEHWRAHNYRLPVHPTTICIRRSLAVALGGWMAVPGSDDTGLLIAASVVSEGYFRDEVGLLYRKWPGQASASSEHAEPVEWNARMNLISERADRLRELWGSRS
jgi:glycosyltransferase involved in cell wall biosynthesis